MQLSCHGGRLTAALDNAFITVISYARICALDDAVFSTVEASARLRLCHIWPKSSAVLR